MKKHHILTFLLASFLVILSLHSVYAQTSIAGDQVCGANSSTKCTLENAKTIASAAMALVIKIGSALLVMFIVYRFITAWFMLRSGNAAAYKTATKDVGNAIVGFVIITAILGGLYVVILQFLGVDAGLLKLFTDAFVPHAYAAGEGLLPNPVGVFDLYDFILTLVKLVMSFFIYPAIIVMWVWSGFAYVAAQGNPEALKKANQWLMWAVITTIVIFMTQGLLFALRGTINNILPETASQTQVVPSNPSMTQPCSGRQAGDACQIGANNGTCTSDGICDIGSVCTGKSVGTACQLGSNPGRCDASGVCFLDKNKTVTTFPSSCYQLPVGARCQLGKDLGTCDASSVCFLDKNNNILPSSCYRLAVGARCRLGSELGTCDSASVCFLDKN